MEQSKSGGEGRFDLFGNPVLPIRDRRGRPSFAKSKENQDFVAVRAAAGWSHSRIAQALGCDDDTLRKYFSGELENGRLYIEGMMLDVLLTKIRDGHTPSIRIMQERIEAVAPKAPRRKPDADADLKKPDALGKKEQQVLAAQKMPDDYGDIFARRGKRDS